GFSGRDGKRHLRNMPFTWRPLSRALLRQAIAFMPPASAHAGTRRRLASLRRTSLEISLSPLAFKFNMRFCRMIAFIRVACLRALARDDAIAQAFFCGYDHATGLGTSVPSILQLTRPRSRQSLNGATFLQALL